MKKFRKKVLGFTTTGVTMGVGASVLSDPTVGSAQGSQAIGRMAGFMPVMGTMYGAGMTMKAMKGMKPKKRRRKR